MARLLTLAGLALTLGACTLINSTAKFGDPEDGGTDAGEDAALPPPDSGVDAGSDAGTDGGSDAGTDGGTDAGTRDCELDPQPDCVTQVSAGGDHTCVLQHSGDIYCWGENDDGELGIGNEVSPQLEPSRVAGISDATHISTGVHHTCAVRSTGSVVCWGRNSFGQLGDGTTTNRSAPAEVIGLSNATEVSAGVSHTCARLMSGEVACWGSGGSGRLGNGGTSNSLTPVMVTGLSTAVRVDIGQYHSCTVRESGDVGCWGLNGSGRLGDGTTTTSSTLVLVTSLGGAEQVSAGGDFTCALLTGGRVACWGDNFSGQLGNGTNDDSARAVNVIGVSDGIDVSTGFFGHACVTRATGTVACWGANAGGKLGDGSTTSSSTPLDLTSLADVAQVSAGAFHTCARTRRLGEVFCWGRNESGEVGNGTTEQQPTPVPVGGL